MMITKMAIKKILRDNNETIKCYGVKNIGLFGSITKNRQTKNSDVDILVEFSKGKKNFDNYMELKLFLEKQFRREVDLVIKGALKSRIKDKILKEVEYA